MKTNNNLVNRCGGKKSGCSLNVTKREVMEYPYYPEATKPALPATMKK